MISEIPQSATWATVIAMALGLVATILASRTQSRTERRRKIDALKSRRRAALAMGRPDIASDCDAALRRLCAIVAILAISCAGCRTAPRAPVVIGIDLLLVSPGESLMVPALPSGDSQWYLATDGALDRLGFSPKE